MGRLSNSCQQWPSVQAVPGVLLGPEVTAAPRRHQPPPRGGGFQVVDLASTADEALAQVEQHKPDVAIIDIRMPPTHTDEGLKAAEEIRARTPTSACWCCRSTSNWAWPPDCSPRTRRDGISAERSHHRPWRVRRSHSPRRRRRGPPTIRPSSRNCWAGAATTTCWSTSLLASVKCWP